MTAGFEAWAYGPVDVDVYKKHKRNELVAFTQEESNEFLRENNPVVNSYLHSMTRKIFNSSDFGLVDLSHRDKVWSDKYDPSVPYNDEVITAEEIVNEYKKK
ncbi:hypothetical protein MGH68_07395 [Erysipelothrix sp. D19-032]